MNPLVSIILPSYNGAHRIARAIESVLSQEYTEWELLVISDGSSDETKEIVTPYAEKDTRIVYIENEHNLGIQKTLNKGLALATGKYIARIDDDDQWTDTNKLGAQVAFFESNSDYVLIGTDATVVDEHAVTLSMNTMPKTDMAIRSKILSKNCFLHSTIMVKKSALERVGEYSENIKQLHAEDYDLWLRVGLVGKMANLPIKSAALIAHSNSLTSRNRVRQARNILRASVAHRKEYPNFLWGYAISLTRLVFFWILSVIPIPTSLWYGIQRIYRSV
jgi:glycosyltransferase involved in cell wall biosynthesis